VLSPDSPEVCFLGSCLRFSLFHAQMHLHIFLDEHIWNSLDKYSISNIIQCWYFIFHIFVKELAINLVFNNRQQYPRKIIFTMIWITWDFG